jgi:hypothetical protein
VDVGYGNFRERRPLPGGGVSEVERAAVNRDMVERERVAVLDIDLPDGNFGGAFEYARTGDLERTVAADLAAVDSRAPAR